MEGPKHEPTPEEIAAACAEFREGWSERDYYRRAGIDLPQSQEFAYPVNVGQNTPANCVHRKPQGSQIPG